MKEVILSADSDSIVYLVPDEVADNLYAYCTEFCDDWLWNSPQAQKYRTGQGVRYSEDDFIEYLNKYKFPDCRSRQVKIMGWTNYGENLPEEYKDCPNFHF